MGLQDKAKVLEVVVISVVTASNIKKSMTHTRTNNTTKRKRKIAWKLKIKKWSLCNWQRIKFDMQVKINESASGQLNFVDQYFYLKPIL